MPRNVQSGNTQNLKSTVIEALNEVRRELGELHSTEGRFDVCGDLCFVGLDRAVFLREQIIALPDIEPLRKRQARRLYLKAIVNGL